MIRKLLLIFCLATLSIPTTTITLQQKIENSLVAAAFGDALGRVTEFIGSTREIFAQYPRGVKSFDDFTHDDWHYLPKTYSSHKIAPYTDDTAMAILVMESLIESSKNNEDLEHAMSRIAHAFVDDMAKDLGWAASFRAPGATCMKYAHILADKVATHQDTIASWWDISPADGKSGGCGSVMRAYPFGLVFSHNPKKAKIWAARHSCITHGDLSAQAACAAIAVGVAHALNNKEPQYIIHEMIEAAREYDEITANAMMYAHALGLQTKRSLTPHQDVFIQLQTNKEFRQIHDTFFNRYLGWSARDAIMCITYLFTLVPCDPMTAIYLGVHTPGDSDSTGSLIGALTGAYSTNLDSSDVLFKKMEGYEYLLKLAHRV